jgi:hypothetical protein
VRRQPKDTARLDTEVIKRRLHEPFHATDTRSKLYVALGQARSDCVALLNEVNRLNAALVELSMFFARRIDQLEQQQNHQPIAMQPAPAGDPAK